MPFYLDHIQALYFLFLVLTSRVWNQKAHVLHIRMILYLLQNIFSNLELLCYLNVLKLRHAMYIVRPLILAISCTFMLPDYLQKLSLQCSFDCPLFDWQLCRLQEFIFLQEGCGEHCSVFGFSYLLCLWCSECNTSQIEAWLPLVAEKTFSLEQFTDL